MDMNFAVPHTKLLEQNHKVRIISHTRNPSTQINSLSSINNSKLVQVCEESFTMHKSTQDTEPAASIILEDTSQDASEFVQPKIDFIGLLQNLHMKLRSAVSWSVAIFVSIIILNLMFFLVITTMPEIKFTDMIPNIVAASYLTQIIHNTAGVIAIRKNMKDVLSYVVPIQFIWVMANMLAFVYLLISFGPVSLVFFLPIIFQGISISLVMSIEQLKNRIVRIEERIMTLNQKAEV